MWPVEGFCFQPNVVAVEKNLSALCCSEQHAASIETTPKIIPPDSLLLKETERDLYDIYHDVKTSEVHRILIDRLIT